MRLHRKESIWLILFIVMAVVSGFVIVSVLESPIRGSVATYKAVFEDVSGLYPGDDVRMSGVQVGKIDSIDLDEKLAIVTFTTLKNEPIFSNTVAAIRYQNLLGQRYLELQRGESGGEILQEHAIIPVPQTVSSFDVSKLFNGFKPLFENLKPEEINQFGENLLKLAQGDGAGLAPLMSDIDNIVGLAVRKQDVLELIIRNLGKVSQEIGGKSSSIGDFIAELLEVLNQLTAEIDAFSDSFDRINPVMRPLIDLLDESEKIYNTEYGPIDALLRKLLPQTPQIVEILSLVPSLITSIKTVVSDKDSQEFSCSNNTLNLSGIALVSFNSQNLVMCR